MSEDERIADILAAVLLVRGFFGDDEKARAWFAARNPLLSGWTPAELLVARRERALLDVIKQQLAENEPPPTEARVAG